MGDMGDTFRALKEHKKKKRKSNTEYSTELVKKHGILLESYNGGAHLVVDAGDTFVDFWPSTGRWIARNGKHGRGVRKLLKFCGIE